MAINLDNPLDTDLPESVAFLSGVQGNILKSHGRDFAAQVFLTFAPDAARARAWLADFARTRVTSARRQKRDRDAWIADTGAGELFASLALAHSGYVALSVPDASIPTDPYFRLGMKRQSEGPRTFNDPPAELWEVPFRGQPDALIILAHDDPNELAEAVERLRADAAAITSALWVETGSRLEVTLPGETEPTTIEHFGFEDGISNPLFYVDDIAAERAARGFSKWDPAAPLKLALVAEPGVQDRFGSYFVFRKLEQNVADFTKAIADLAQRLGADGNIEQAGALAVGRFRNGAPVLPASGTAPDPNGNNFHFKTDDPDGSVCPFHAHIRKTNPRGDTPLPADLERLFRVVRRGITYGERPDLVPGAYVPPPERGVGLLFMSCQARLDQFAIQQEGSDSNDFAQPGVGVDAVIGQNPSPVPQKWGKGDGVPFTMANFVTLLGGEYFFVPSLEFLRLLDA